MPTNELNQTRDRITSLLRNTTPSGSDIFKASARAIGGTRLAGGKMTSFGNELSKLRANRINEEMTLLEVMSKAKTGELQERRVGLEEKRLGIATEELDFKRIKLASDIAATQGDAQAKAFSEAVGFLGIDDLPAQDSSAIGMEIAKRADSFKGLTDSKAVMGILSEIMAGLQISSPLKATDRFRVVGDKLVDISGEQPKVALALPKDAIPKDELLRLQQQAAALDDQTVQAQADGDDALASRLANERKQVADRINKITKVVTETGDVVSFKAEVASATTTARLIAKRREDATEKQATIQTEIVNIADALNKAQSDTGGDITGMRALLAQRVGGLLGQISPDLETGFSTILGGATPEQVAAFQVQVRTIIAQNIETISGEESGRFSEMERAITELAVQASRPGASQAQVTAALSALLKFKIIMRDFQLIRSGRMPKNDLTTREGRAALIGELRPMGLSDDDLVNLVRRMLLVRQEIIPVFIDAN